MGVARREVAGQTHVDSIQRDPVGVGYGRRESGIVGDSIVYFGVVSRHDTDSRRMTETYQSRGDLKSVVQEGDYNDVTMEKPLPPH